MKLLTPENSIFDMTTLPQETDADIRFFVLDYSNPTEVDLVAIPLLFVESYTRSAADLKIGPYRVMLPLDWSIVIVDKHLGMVELLELRHLNDRDFTALVYNPLKGFMPEFHEITMMNIFSEVSWYVPKLKYGHILVIPLTSGPAPVAIYAVKDHHRIPESLDISKIIQ